MTCRCGETARVEARHTFRRTVASIAFTAEAVVDACKHCGEPIVPAALVIAFERAVAAELARRGPISGETFRWIRKAAGLERPDLARYLGVPSETLSAWEEERRATDIAAWTLVAALALDGVEGPRPLRARLRRRHQGPQPSPVRVTLDVSSVGTVGKALRLLSTPLAFTDADIADALDVDPTALRACLRHLVEIGLLIDGAPAAGSKSWTPATTDHAKLLEKAAELGVDVGAPLPRAKRLDGAIPIPQRRMTPMAWRATT